MDQQVTVSFTGPYISKQRVFWDQLDFLGVLHNAAYILLFERARTEFWRSLGINGYGEDGLDWPYFVARNEVNYRLPIMAEEEITVSVWVSRLGETSLTFGHQVFRADGQLSAEGETVIVRVDSETQRPFPWSDSFREKVKPYLFPDAI
jgi:acyl-CoA thioester hydrolase